MSMETEMEKSRDFILEYLQREYELPQDFDPETFDFVKSGYVDSLGLLQFIAVLEDEFGIEFTDDELESEDFPVLGKLIRLVQKKMESKQ